VLVLVLVLVVDSPLRWRRARANRGRERERSTKSCWRGSPTIPESGSGPPPTCIGARRVVYSGLAGHSDELREW